MKYLGCFLVSTILRNYKHLFKGKDPNYSCFVLLGNVYFNLPSPLYLLFLQSKTPLGSHTQRSKKFDRRIPNLN